MADVSATRTRYAAAWAVLLGSLLVLIVAAAGAILGGADGDALLGMWFSYVALQLVVFAVLVVIEQRLQRNYWSHSIPVDIVIAQVVAGLSEILVGRPADSAEATHADVLF